MTEQIEPLKKLTLRIAPATEDDTRAITFDHIFGLVPEGLSAFESALEGKKQDDSILLSVPGIGFREFFGNCAVYVQDLVKVPVLPKAIDLTITIVSVTDADHREIVKSIAAAASHGGCGGSCGCGCS